MTEIRSRPATLTEWIPDTLPRCPACQRRVGRQFTAYYDGDPQRPETVRLAGWQCHRCLTYHPVDSPTS